MIYVTGDTHGRFGRLQPGIPGQCQLGADDYLIICGDFGGIWRGGEEEDAVLDALNALPFTILFADGNHENYNLLSSYPVCEWNGGKAQKIRSKLIHLMRGQIYTLEGKTIFVMGGAESHDIQHGILDMNSADFERKYRIMRATGKFFRVKDVSWWEQELPSLEELEEGRRNLDAVNWKVDYIITHCYTAELQDLLSRVSYARYPSNRLTDFMAELEGHCDYKTWYCGHYHTELTHGKTKLLYEHTVPLCAPEDS